MTQGEKVPVQMRIHTGNEMKMHICSKFFPIHEPKAY